MATGGNAPLPTGLDSLPTDWGLFAAGCAWFVMLLLFATRKLFPSFFNKLTLGFFTEPSDEMAVAKQLALLRHEVGTVRLALLQASADRDPDDDREKTSPPLNRDTKIKTGPVDIIGQLDNAILAKLDHSGESLSIAELSKLRRTFTDEQDKATAKSDLNVMIELLMDNAVRSRTRVFTLFAGVNMWLVVLAASTLVVKVEVTPPLLQAIFGLYVSMAVFLVYVYRNSSSRISVLLALKEDQNHQHEAASYLARLRPNATLSERDVEALKLILVNHAERENGNDHPYELVLKGITNSTVMLKGGKVITPNRSAK